MTTPKEIGNIFKEARERHNLSIDDAHRQSRIHPNVIKDIESGVFDRIGKLYIKSFMKKYSAVLGLDTESIMEKYESISSEVPSLEFDLGTEEKKDTGNQLQNKRDDVLLALNDKKMQTILAVILSIILVVLVFVFIGMVRSKVLLSRQQKGIAASKEVATVAAKEDVQKARRKAPAAKTSALVILSLKARGKVWVQVTKGEDTLFAGILERGDSKTWRSDGPLTVWTGKGEMLDFAVNTHRIGKVAAGVVKNIKVSSSGVKIGNVWVARLD